jgi:transcriptional regulator with XRE-family HTH domain
MIYNIFVENETSFSKNIVRLRKERGMSQKELAKLAGISQRMLVYYEKKAGNPPIEKIKRIAEVLKVNIDELLLDAGKKSKKSEIDISQMNTKTLKRVKQILNLTPEERHIVYSLIDSLITKRTKKTS